MARPARGLPRPALRVVLFLAALGHPGVARELTAPNVDPRLGPLIRHEVLRAASRLERTGCALVLSDFPDAETGLPLAERLPATAESSGAYLASLIYRPGPPDGPCRSAATAAYTSPGSSVVYVCPLRFHRWKTGHEANLPANILIHEALHTLGLGEDPPASEEITARIEARCGK